MEKEIVSYLTRGEFFISPTQIPHGKFVRSVELKYTPNNPVVALAGKTSYIVFTPCPPDEHVLGEALWLALFLTFCSYLCVIFTEPYENTFKF